MFQKPLIAKKLKKKDTRGRNVRLLLIEVKPKHVENVIEIIAINKSIPKSNWKAEERIEITRNTRQKRRKKLNMVCNPFNIPIDARISSTRDIRCQNGQLHRIQYYRCTICQEETVQNPAQEPKLVPSNKNDEERARLGKERFKEIHER